VVGFSAEAWAKAFDPPQGDVSHYTQALVAALYAHGHDTDIARLLDGVRSSVAGMTHDQAPCAYSAKPHDLFLFHGSLVGTSLVSAESSSLTVNDVVLPLVRAFRAEVSGVVSTSCIHLISLTHKSTERNRTWESESDGTSVGA
jgi:hypothetical protein